MNVTVYSKLPDGFSSWAQFLISSTSTHNLCEKKQREFYQLHEKIMQEFGARITPSSENCIVLSYPLPAHICASKPFYGNYQFRFLNTDTGTRRQVPLEDQKQHGLNKCNGTCLFKDVLAFHAHRNKIEELAKFAEKKFSDRLLDLYDQYRNFIVPALLPPARERYAIYLKSRQWHEKSLVVKQRDQHRCVACYSTTGLEVHHKTYERWGNEQFDDLMTVCRACHARIHGLYPV